MTLCRKLADQEEGRLVSQNNHLLSYQEEASSDSMLETVSLTCFYYYNHTQWLAWRTLPLCLTVN